MKIKYGFRSNFRSFKSAITLAFLVLILNYNEAKAQWSALGAGANDMVYAISPDVAGTGIYCALNFGNISATKNWIQSSNGTAAPANLNANAYVNGYIYAIAVVGTKIYVGGDFTTAQGAGTYGGVACWNTATNSWSNLGTGASGSNKTVYSLLYDAANNLLYAGGEFTSMSGTAAANIAAYNLGTGTWSALGSGCTTLPAGSASGTTVGVYALTQCGTNIYAGGRFVNAGGVASNNIAAWNGSAWSTLTSGGQAGVMNITVVGPNVACAVWDAGVMALTSDGTNVYAGGDFDKAGGVTGYHNIGCWNTGTSAWSKLGTGMQLPLGSESGMAATLGDNANVWALTMFNGNLIAGGDFEQAGTIAPVGGNLFIAQWNGSAWSGFNTSCGTDLNSDVFALGVSGGYLYAGGQFSPTSPYYIAKYTGAGPTMTMNVGTGTTICSTGSVALSVSGATSYTWTTGTGLSCTNCSNPTASPTTTTVYTVTGTTSGCSSTKTVTITVVATPTLTVNSPTICIGSAAVLTASSASAYSWSTGAITNTISVSPGVGSTTYTVTGDNGSGCTATKTATVTVSDQPTLTISGSATHCTGSAMILTGSTTAGTYTWSANAGSVTTSTVSVNPGAGSVTYTLNGTNGACSNNTTLTVSVTATPTLTVNSPTVCAGQSAVLTAATANSYSWSTTETTNTISVSPGVGTTTYTVTGDNGNGCTSTKTATVTVSAQPTVSISGAAAHCSGSAMTLTGSTTAGTFTWSANAGGVSTSTVSVNPGLGNTTYTLNGSVGTCTATTTITVSVTPSPTLTVNSPTICSGQTATLTAATANNYSWSTTETTPSITVSPANTTTYTVTGDNGAGCTSTKTATVTVNPTPTVVISGAHVICQGQTITLSGATAASYTWMPGGTNGSTLSVTPPNGSHTYTLTGANGACTATDVATVDVSPSPTLSVNNASICSGQSVVLSASGATTFSWSANAGGVMSPTVSVNPTTTTVYTVGGIVGLCKDSVTTTVTVSPSPTLTLPANSYTVCLGNSATLGVNGATTYTWTTGTGLSCTNCQNPVSTPTTATIYTVSGTTGSCTSAASVTVSVNVNPLPTLTLSPSSNSICSSNSSTITVSGASTYTWSPGGSLSGTNGSTVTATPGTTTDYTVSGTDVNGCMNTSVVTITVSPTPTINISPVPPAACSGQSVVLNGGTASTYTWSSNAGGVNTATVSVTPNATTTYTLTGTTGSCTASAVATVTVNPLPTVGASTVVPAACGQSNGCIDTVLVSNGTPGYQYSWDHGITWSNAAQHCNIPTGSYEVVVKDLNGCLDSTSIAVSNLNGPPAPGVAAVAAAVCLGANDSLSIVAPVGTYTYTWTDATGIHTGTSYTITNIGPAGNYNVSVSATDVNGCVAVTNTTIVVNSLPPTTLSGTTHFCKGTSSTLSAAPNGGGYTYQWSQGGTPIGGATSYTYSAGAAGVYNVEITDNSTGCKANALTDYTVTVDSLPKIDTTSMVINPSNCGGSTGSVSNVSVTPAGGTTYTWTDQNGVVVGTSLNLSGVPDGQYCIHATTNPENCKDSLCSITVTNPNAPATPVLTTTNNAYCQGQTQNPIVVTGSVTLTWYSDPGLTTQIATGTTYTPNVVTTTTVYVTATNSGCVSPALPVVITINTTPADPLVATPSYTYCSSQTPGTITATGAPTILWSTSPSMNPVINTGTSFTPTGLLVGTTTYYLQDSSAAGCKSTGTTTVSVTINQTPADPTVSATPAAYCQGDVISPLTANGTGTILWYDNAGLTPVISTGSSYTPPGTVGTFTYYVIDSSAAGCKSTGTVTVSVTVNPTPANPTVSATGTNVCNGVPVGTYTASSTSGGTLIWSTSPAMSPIIYTGAVLTPTNTIGTTTYYVQDTSVAGCASNGIDSVTITIYQSPAITGTGKIDTAKCGGLNGGIDSLNVTGGTPIYHYQWTDPSGNPVGGDSMHLANMGPGNYSLTVTDANGCVATGGLPMYVIPSISSPTLDIMPVFTQGTSPVSVTFTANASAGVTTYNWNMGDGTSSNLPGPSNTYTAAGTYTVILTADNGTCAARDTAIVVVDSPVSILIPNIYSPNGDGINDEFFITCVGIKNLHCDIFNRWGQLIYQMFAVDDKWDGVMINGNDATDGTYFYILDATGFDGKKYNSKGSLTLVR